MISKKLLLLQRLTEHLEGINPDNTFFDPDTETLATYPIDMRNQVFRGRVLFGEEVVPPFIALLEAPRQINPNGGGEANLTQKEDWTLLIQGFASENPAHPTDPAYELLAFVQQRLARVTTEKDNGGRGGQYPLEWRLGGLLTDIRYQLPIVRPGSDDVSNTAYFYMPISVGVVTELIQPFVTGDDDNGS